MDGNALRLVTVKSKAPLQAIAGYGNILSLEGLQELLKWEGASLEGDGLIVMTVRTLLWLLAFASFVVVLNAVLRSIWVVWLVCSVRSVLACFYFSSNNYNATA